MRFPYPPKIFEESSVVSLYIYSVHFIPPLSNGVPASCYRVREHDWPTAPRVGDHVSLTPTVRGAPSGVTFEQLATYDVVRMEFFDIEQEQYPQLAEGGFCRDKNDAINEWAAG